MKLSQRARATSIRAALAIVATLSSACSESPVSLSHRVAVRVTATHTVASGGLALDYEAVNHSGGALLLYGCGAPFAPVLIYRPDGAQDTSELRCLGIQILSTIRLAAGDTLHGTRLVPATAGARYPLGVRFSPLLAGSGETVSWAPIIGPI